MMTRYMTSASLGATMAFGLLYLMNSLIATGNAVMTPGTRGAELTWILDLPEETPPQVEETIKRVSPPELPPANTPPTTIDPTGDFTGVAVPLLRPDRYKPTASTGAQNDVPLVNMMRVRPIYPPRAAARGLEGYVTVVFDVTAAGAVINVVILDSSDPIFEKAAVDAARRFRFKPRVIDGIPRESTGMRNRFRFEMDK